MRAPRSMALGAARGSKGNPDVAARLPVTFAPIWNVVLFSGAQSQSHSHAHTRMYTHNVHDTHN